ncbi:ABC transporter ATP-binding protein [Roseobacter sp. HKCCA2468]|jgi:iron complex transport system ATP-binding protein|uniref:ABC transporter ATP-binding protein n=1 Tax=Roseobacter sp. HKCCA2468 TaxID=3120342 RepID=UPI0030EBF8C9
MTTSCLSLQDFTVHRGECPVVDRVSTELRAGDLVGLIGPNGAGKTTLMRGALGLLPHQGHSSLSALPANARARAVAWLPQTREIAWPVSVETLVMLGRVPHLGAGQSPRADDHAAVSEALAAMDLTGFATRPATALSGGEQARVLMARALAQNCPLIMADEPVAGLDPRHQIATLAHLQSLTQSGKAALVSLHDLGLAARFCDRLILMDRGQKIAEGPPEDVLTEDHLRRVFGITAHITQSEQGLIFQALEVVE